MEAGALLLLGVALYIIYRYGQKENFFNPEPEPWTEPEPITPDNPSPAGVLPNPGCPRNIGPNLFDVAQIKIKAERFKTQIDNSAKTFGIDSRLITAIIAVESMFDPNAIGDNGKSFGLMQVQLETAKDMGFTGKKELLLDPQINIDYGTKYLKYQKDRYNGYEKFMIAAYNSGSVRFLGACPEGHKNSIIYTGETYKCLTSGLTWNYMPIEYTGLINHDYFCKVWRLWEKL